MQSLIISAGREEDEKCSGGARLAGITCTVVSAECRLDRRAGGVCDADFGEVFGLFFQKSCKCGQCTVLECVVLDWGHRIGSIHACWRQCDRKGRILHRGGRLLVEKVSIHGACPSCSLHHIATYLQN